MKGLPKEQQILDGLSRGANLVNKPLGMLGRLASARRDRAPAVFVKGKYGVPVDSELVRNKRSAQGIASPSSASRVRGWSRGNHKHKWDLLIAPVSGLFEFTIGGQRFVVAPGDELYYPAGAISPPRTDPVESAKCRSVSAKCPPDHWCIVAVPGTLTPPGASERTNNRLCRLRS